MVVLLVTNLVATNAQCATTCAIGNCRPSHPSVPPCHGQELPAKGHLPSPPCSDEISIDDAKANLAVSAATAFLADFTAPLVPDARMPSSFVRTDLGDFPLVPVLTRISAIRI